MPLLIRSAGEADLPLLAQMNKRLIEDEGSRNPMSIDQLAERMRGWLLSDWEVRLFATNVGVVGYAVYQARRDEYFPDQTIVYLRQFYIERELRGQGLGTAACRALVAEHFPPESQGRDRCPGLESVGLRFLAARRVRAVQHHNASQEQRMKLHPLLNDPQAVLVSQTPVSEPVGWDAYRAAARGAMAAMQIELAGEKAVIKPNVTVGEKYANPDTGIGVHPGFVHGMFDHLVEHGGRRSAVYVLEDPRNADDNQPRHWRGTGYDTLALETGIKLRCPTTYTCVKKPVPQHQTHPTLNVSRLAVGPNTVLFNVPKLKTHNLAITTLCLKNMMGAVNVFDRHYCAQAWEEIPQGVARRSRGRGMSGWTPRCMSSGKRALRGA